jgi:Sec-independent protein translocase protein TatA
MKNHFQLVLILILLLVGMEQLTPETKQNGHKLKKKRFSHKKSATKGNDDKEKPKEKAKATDGEKTKGEAKEKKSIEYGSSEAAVKDMNGVVGTA